MRLYEYEAKKIFDNYGITIPKQISLVSKLEDLETLQLEYPVMLKAMALIGGRGKAGGIRKAASFEEVRTAVDKILGLSIQGYSINRILLEKAVEVASEIYFSVTTDPATFDVIIITSASGGVDIEEIAKNQPEEIWKQTIKNNSLSLQENIADEIIKFLIDKNNALSLAKQELKKAIISLYSVFQQVEAKICEVNPLIVTTDNEVVAADAKLVLDDNSLFRQAPLLKSIGIDPRSKRHDVAEQTVFEAKAYKIGFPYVDLLDDPSNFVKDENILYVALVPGGAGYGIFSIDEVVNIGNRYFSGKVVPINFMDSGGGPSLDKVADMFHLLMDHPATDLIITSRFGGISSCDIFIQGLVMALRDRYMSKKRMRPVFGRMVGTDLAAAREFYEKAKTETPEPLKDLHIVVGNQKIMADVIKDGIEYGFKIKKEENKNDN